MYLTTYVIEHEASMSLTPFVSLVLYVGLLDYGENHNHNYFD